MQKKQGPGSARGKGEEMRNRMNKAIYLFFARPRPCPLALLVCIRSNKSRQGPKINGQPSMMRANVAHWVPVGGWAAILVAQEHGVAIARPTAISSFGAVDLQAAGSRVR